MIGPGQARRPNGHSVIAFGVYELDVRAGELRKQGVKIKLQDQPFQVLQVLLERPGEVVTREELQQRIWPADTFVDFDHGLSNAVKRLREALGDSAENPRFIETLKRRGYRFIGHVNGNGNGAGYLVATGEVLAFPVPDSDSASVPQQADAAPAFVAKAWRRRGFIVSVSALTGVVLLLSLLLAFRLVRSPGDHLDLPADVVARLKQLRPVNPEALDHYLNGRAHLDKACQLSIHNGKEQASEAEFQAALGYFRQAIKADPEYVPPYLAFWELADFWSPHPDLIPEAKPALEKAVALNPTAAKPHMFLANFKQRYEWDWDGAKRELKRAIQVEPFSADAHQAYSDLLNVVTPRIKEAKEESELAQRLDPEHDRHSNVGLPFADLFPTQEMSLESARNYLDTRAPDDGIARSRLAIEYAMIGNFKDAVEQWAKSMDIYGYHDMAELLRRKSKTGDYRGALLAWIDAWEEKAKHAWVPPFLMAFTYSSLGEKDRAFAWLEKAYAERNWCMIYLKNDHVWDPLRSDPRFTEFLRRVKLER